MKRLADKQLTQDNVDDDDVQEVPTDGFKKADERTLAGRKIRGLPKRGLATTTPITPVVTSNSTETEGKSRFSGFVGFGAPAAPPSGSFSFSAPKPPTTTAPLFGSTATTTTTPQNVSPSASNATKAFASFLNKPLESETPPAHPALAPAATSEKPDPAEVNHYLALRGLNESFLSTLKQAIEKDPFSDFSMLFDQYKRHRASEGDKWSAKSKSSTTAPSIPKSTPAATSEPPKPPAAMPAPPSSFAGFSGFGSSTPLASKPTPTTSSGGFTPKPDAPTDVPKSSFSFPSSSSAPSTGFSFGKPATTEAKPDEPKASTTPAFSFAKPATQETKAPASSGPSFAKPTKDDTKASTTSGFTFGSSAFGAKDTTTDKESSDGKEKAPIPNFFASTSEKEKTTSPFGTSTSSAFGAGSTSAFGTSTFGSGGFGATTPSPFGSSSTTPATFGTSSTTGGFGFMSKPGGSLGNPVGFGFGSPPKTADPSGDKPSSGFSFAKHPDAKGGLADGATSNGFSFAKPVESTSEANGEDTNGGTTEGGSEAPVLGGPNPHDVEGEGEEDEETTHEIKAKAFKLKTDKDGKTLWAEMGVGIFRLKKNKTSESRRMLMRNSSTGKVMINANLYAGLNPSVTKKAVKFVAHDEESNSQTYTLRVATEAQAGDLKDAFEREIALVKAKNGD